MGNRRMGLGRMEKLMESLKREIDLTTTQLITGRGTPALLTDTASTDLTEAANAGRTNILVNVGQNSTYNLPTPSGAGVYYHFVFGGTAAEAENILLRCKTTDNSVFMQGSLQFVDDGGDASAPDWADGNSNELLTLTNPQYVDVHFVSLSTTKWLVWGSVTADTAPVFAD